MEGEMKDLGVIRKRKGMSISQLSSKSGISVATLVEYEKGAREIPSTDLSRLAKVLYVNEWDINRRSSPPPATPEERGQLVGPSRPKRPPREKKPRPPSPPARDSQIAHLLGLAARLGIGQAALEEEIGKPLTDLTQKEARDWNGKFARRCAEQKSAIERKRGYLPESVDSFELAYLLEQQDAGALLHFTLFDGQAFEGAVVGFGPYQITIREPGGDETTLNKLAIAYYRKSGGEE
jgi:transcriptional regulator with XRE-family HTH domain